MSDVKPRDVQVALIGTDTTVLRSRGSDSSLKWNTPAAGYNCQFLSNSGRQNGSLDPPGESFTEIYLQLQQHLDLQHLDYVILGHVNPNRTVTLKALLELAPQVTFICSGAVACGLPSQSKS